MMTMWEDQEQRSHHGIVCLLLLLRFLLSEVNHHSSWEILILFLFLFFLFRLPYSHSDDVVWISGDTVPTVRHCLFCFGINHCHRWSCLWRKNHQLLPRTVQYRTYSTVVRTVRLDMNRQLSIRSLFHLSLFFLSQIYTYRSTLLVLTIDRTGTGRE